MTGSSCPVCSCRNEQTNDTLGLREHTPMKRIVRRRQGHEDLDPKASEFGCDFGSEVPFGGGRRGWPHASLRLDDRS